MKHNCQYSAVPMIHESEIFPRKMMQHQEPKKTCLKKHNRKKTNQHAIENPKPHNKQVSCKKNDRSLENQRPKILLQFQFPMLPTLDFFQLLTYCTHISSPINPTNLPSVTQYPAKPKNYLLPERENDIPQKEINVKIMCRY